MCALTAPYRAGTQFHCISIAAHQQNVLLLAALFFFQGPCSSVWQSNFTQTPPSNSVCQIAFWKSLQHPGLNASTNPGFQQSACHIKPHLAWCSSLSPPLSATKTDSRGLRTHKPHRHIALGGSNPTVHCGPAFRQPAGQSQTALHWLLFLFYAAAWCCCFSNKAAKPQCEPWLRQRWLQG